MTTPDDNFARIAGLTDSDRSWLTEQLALAGGAPTIPTGRMYLSCGHQVGGPYDVGPRACPTCARWLAEHPETHRTRTVPPPRVKRWRRPGGLPTTLMALALGLAIAVPVNLVWQLVKLAAAVFAVPPVLILAAAVAAVAYQAIR